jgi:hypothetical protein
LQRAGKTLQISRALSPPQICHTPFVKSFTYQRLEMLQSRFQLHCKLNSSKEVAESKRQVRRCYQGGSIPATVSPLSHPDDSVQ